MGDYAEYILRWESYPIFKKKLIYIQELAIQFCITLFCLVVLFFCKASIVSSQGIASVIK